MDVNNNGIPFSSFLAGCLLIKNSISNSELCNISSDFTIRSNVYFEDDNKDYNYDRISFLFSEGSKFELKYKYNDIIKLTNGEKITVYKYLYNYTHDMVIKYFKLPDEYEPNFKWEMDTTTKKRRS